MSVGTYYNEFLGSPAGSIQGVRDDWNGSSWSALNVPLLSSGHDLVDVSCVSATFCVAVGSHNLQTLAEKWNGSSWSTMTTKNTVPPHAQPSNCIGTSCYQSDDGLNNVSCLSATFCVAVGTAEGPTAPSPTVDELWNGTAWSVMPFTGSNNANSAVSCTSTTFCMAIGGSTSSTWNGSSWSPVPIAGAVSPYYLDNLSEVSCSSPAFCVAVGSTIGHSVGDQTLAQEWDGSTWSTMTTTNPSSQGDFGGGGVSCSSASFCVAVGSTYGPGEPSQTIAEEWDGANWSTMTTINPVSGDVNVFSGVSCPAVGSCVAVGWNGLGSGSQMFSEIFSSAG
jgi:hypothetical protein